MNSKYFLPGTDEQIKILLRSIEIKDFSVLVIGEGSEQISKEILAQGASKIIMIVQNEDSLLRARMNSPSTKNIFIRMMEFDNTDFKDSSFDLVYAQASISVPNRNKIIKEIKRVLKTNGYLCVGEIVKMTQTPPQFVNDVYNNSNVSPLFSEEIENFYRGKKFEIIFANDISFTLREFYKLSNNLLKERANDLSDEEKSYYKKLLKQFSHESSVFLKLGGNAYMGFIMLLLKKVKV
jgi:ubiquinone/menaquinone biosynthesis C-methylase UbiE